MCLWGSVLSCPSCVLPVIGVYTDNLIVPCVKVFSKQLTLLLTNHSFKDCASSLVLPCAHKTRHVSLDMYLDSWQWCFCFNSANSKGLSSNCWSRWVWFGDDNKSNAFNIGLLFIGSSVCCWWPPKTSLASAATSSGETSHYLYQAFKAAKNGEAVLIGFKGCLVGCIKQERHWHILLGHVIFSLLLSTCP